MEGQRIIVASGDETIRQQVATRVKEHGYEVATVASADELESQLHEPGVEFVLLDTNLPPEDGFKALRRVRELSLAPVIVLNGLPDTVAVVELLNFGADDVITKPIDFAVLHARMRAVGRRCRMVEDESEQPLELPPLQVGPLHLDFSRQEAIVNGTALDLSGKELLLLYVLAQNPGSLIPRSTILDIVWAGDVSDESKTLDVHMSRLRRKLDEVGLGDMVKTIRRRGYLLSSELERLPA